MNLEEALDEVYAAPIEEFTQTRNALAKEFADDKDAASTLKQLKKPNLAAWAINQLARRHGDVLDELFATTGKLRLAQRRVMSGGRATELRKATDERNAIIGKLTKLASKILAEAGHGASSSTLAAVNDSFVAVASDEEGAELLRKGRLTRELEPSSFVDVGGLSLVEDVGDEAEEPATEEREKPDRSAVLEARKALSEARNAAKEARAAFKAANAEALRVGREADEAEQRARSARESAEFARRAAEARRAEVEEAEQAIEGARRVLQDME